MMIIFHHDHTMTQYDSPFLSEPGREPGRDLGENNCEHTGEETTIEFVEVFENGLIGAKNAKWPFGCFHFSVVLRCFQSISSQHILKVPKNAPGDTHKTRKLLFLRLETINPFLRIVFFVFFSEKTSQC